MSSICWAGYETKNSTAMDHLRRRAYLYTFYLLLWGINLTIAIAGLPFILIGKLVAARPGNTPHAGKALTSN